MQLLLRERQLLPTAVRGWTRVVGVYCIDLQALLSVTQLYHTGLREVRFATLAVAALRTTEGGMQQAFSSSKVSTIKGRVSLCNDVILFRMGRQQR